MGLRYRWVNGERFAERYADADSTNNQESWAAGRNKWKEREQGMWGDFNIMKMSSYEDRATTVFEGLPSSEGYSSGEESVESSRRSKKRRMGSGRPGGLLGRKRK